MQILGKFAGKFAGKIAPKLGFFLGLAFAYAAGDSLANLGATVTRASTATYIDSNGVLQTASSGVARDGHYINGVRTLLLEGQRTNSFLNSGTPATHTSPSLGTGAYTLWLVGTGSIAVAAGTATITGAGTATAATPVTFTVTVAGTVTFTVTGSPTRAQCENGPSATSYIATAGSAVTRSADSLSFPFGFPPQALSAYFKAIDAGSIAVASTVGLFNISNGANATERLEAYLDATAKLNGVHTNAGAFVNVTPGAAIAAGSTIEARVVLSSTGQVTVGQSINGGAEVTGGPGTADTLGAAFAAPTLWVNSLGTVAGTTGYIALQSFKVALGVQSLVTMRGL